MGALSLWVPAALSMGSPDLPHHRGSWVHTASCSQPALAVLGAGIQVMRDTFSHLVTCLQTPLTQPAVRMAGLAPGAQSMSLGRQT